MNRTTVALFAALEALIAVAVGLGIVLVPLTVLWATQFGMATDWTVFWRAAADVWLAGHGVDLTITLPAATIAGLGLPGAAAPFTVTIALLGFALIAVLFGARTGLRAARTGHWLSGAIAAVIVYGVLGAGIAGSAGGTVVAVSGWQGVLLPALVFAIGVAIGVGGCLARSPSRDPDTLPRGIRARFAALAPGTRDGLLAALRGGSAAAALLLGAAATVTTLFIFLNFGTVIGLYESLHAGALGGAALTVGQILFIPNVVIWAASWLAGPGFALGAGSSVGPVGTQLGPIPGLPLFGALPHGEPLFGFLGLAVPLLCGFAAAALVASRVPAVHGSSRSLRWSALAALGIGLVAGVGLGLLSWWSSGALGPGRLQEVGPNPWLVGLLTAFEVALGAGAGLAARRHR